MFDSLPFSGPQQQSLLDMKGVASGCQDGKAVDQRTGAIHGKGTPGPRPIRATQPRQVGPLFEADIRV